MSDTTTTTTSSSSKEETPSFFCSEFARDKCATYRAKNWEPYYEKCSPDTLAQCSVCHGTFCQTCRVHVLTPGTQPLCVQCIRGMFANATVNVV